MSNRLFQSLVHQMRDVVDRVIGVLDENSVIISCSDLSRIGEADPSMKVVLMEGHDAVVGDGYTYKTFGSHIQPEYCVFVEGTDETAAQFAGMLAVSLSGINSFTMKSTIGAISLRTSSLTTFCQVTFMSRQGNCTSTRM